MHDGAMTQLFQKIDFQVKYKNEWISFHHTYSSCVPAFPPDWIPEDNQNAKKKRGFVTCRIQDVPERVRDLDGYSDAWQVCPSGGESLRFALKF